jgi:general stress protein YciG
MCKATTNAGRERAAPAMKGGGFCALHADPSRAAELGRMGGMGNRHIYEDDGREVAAPRNASDVKDLLAEAPKKLASQLSA